MWCVRWIALRIRLGEVGTLVHGFAEQEIGGAGGGTGGSKCGLGSLLSHPLSFTPGRESFDRDSGSLVDIR